MRPSCVVRIFATTQEPDYDNPWQSHSPAAGTGSGVVVGPGQILTGAHVVANCTFVRVQNSTSPDKFVATVRGLGHDCDLALLEVADPRFMKEVEIAEIGELPARRDKVSVVGFPVGGEELSVTEGVVSRVELQRYSHSQRRLLAVTVDAAINEGNSGGPVFLGDRVSGIAFQSLEGAENVGEMVPAPLVRRFLAGIKEDKALEIPGLGLVPQTLENPALRRSLGMSAGQTGIVARKVGFGSSVYGQIVPGDVLMKIDGYEIANNGTINYLGRFRTSFLVLLGEHYIGDHIDVVILRDGAPVELSIELKEVVRLVPDEQFEREPTYFVFAGLVFQPLSADFLSTWSKWHDMAPKEFLYHYYFGSVSDGQREVVALTQILADEITVGYESLYSESVVDVGGVKPKDMADFVRLVEAEKGQLRVRLSTGSLVVVDVEEARAADQRIRKRYHIPRDRSADLQDG